MKIVMVIPVLFALQVYSQEFKKEFKLSSRKTELNTDNLVFDVSVNNKGKYSAAYTNNIPATIVRDFMGRYLGVSGARWYVDEKEVTAYFEFQLQSITLIYKKDGYLLSTRKIYDSSSLDPAVHTFLANEYLKGFVINLVTEVTREENKFYDISLFSQGKLQMIRLSQRKSDGILADGKIVYDKVDLFPDAK